MLQYKIPQNIGIEDKIVGPFSLRQLIIVAAGCGISYVLFAITSKLYELNVLEYIIIAIPAIIAIAAALVKINNITLPKFVLLSLEFAIKPKRRMWDHRGISALVAPDLTNKQTAATTPIKTEDKEDKKNVNLRDLTKVLDSGGFDHIEDIEHKDIDKVQDDDLVTQAFFGHKKDKSETNNMYWRTKESQKKRLDILAKMPKTKTKEETTSEKKDKEKVESKPKEVKETKPEQKIEIKRQEPVKQEINKPEVKKPEESTKQQVQTEPIAPKKKKRRRKRKPKSQQPARQETQINNTKAKEPVKLIQKERVEQKPKQQPEKPQPKEVKQINNKPKQKEAPTPEAPKAKDSGEFHISDLQKGEIEINLD